MSAIGTTTRHVISKGKSTTEVVYKTHVSNHKGRPIYASRTKHEPNRMTVMQALANLQSL